MRSAMGPATKGATRAPTAIRDEIQASSSEVMGLLSGESDVSAALSLGPIGEVHPRVVPTTNADKLADR